MIVMSAYRAPPLHISPPSNCVKSNRLGMGVSLSLYIYRQTPQCIAAHAFSMRLPLVCDGWKSGSFDVIGCLRNASYHLLCVYTCGLIEHGAFYPVVVFFM